MDGRVAGARVAREAGYPGLERVLVQCPSERLRRHDIRRLQPQCAVVHADVAAQLERETAGGIVGPAILGRVVELPRGDRPGRRRPVVEAQHSARLVRGEVADSGALLAAVPSPPRSTFPRLPARGFRSTACSRNCSAASSSGSVGGRPRARRNMAAMRSRSLCRSASRAIRSAKRVARCMTCVLFIMSSDCAGTLVWSRWPLVVTGVGRSSVWSRGSG